jgi:hypothetical protein
LRRVIEALRPQGKSQMNTVATRPWVRYLKSFLFGLIAGAIALTLVFGVGWVQSTRIPEVGWLGTLYIFGLLLGMWYCGFFLFVALPFFIVVDSKRLNLRPEVSIAIGAIVFSAGTAAAAYLYGEHLGDLVFFAALAAVSGGTAFYVRFRGLT